jgi:hypothetical protein
MSHNGSSAGAEPEPRVGGMVQLGHDPMRLLRVRLFSSTISDLIEEVRLGLDRSGALVDLSACDPG